MVLGYDGTPHSDVALDWAARYATVHGRPLRIGYAAGVPTAYDSFSDIQVNREELRAIGEQILGAAALRVHGLSPGLLGSVSLELSAHAPCPVVVPLAVVHAWGAAGVSQHQEEAGPVPGQGVAGRRPGRARVPRPR